MGAVTKSGRSRNRRAQQLSSIISGQSAQLYAYGCSLAAGGVLTVGVWTEQLVPYETLAAAPDAMLRVILLNGTGAHPQTVPVTVGVGGMTFTTTPHAIATDNLLVLAWNEDVRGAQGEWISGAMLDVTV